LSPSSALMRRELQGVLAGMLTSAHMCGHDVEDAGESNSAAA